LLSWVVYKCTILLLEHLLGEEIIPQPVLAACTQLAGLYSSTASNITSSSLVGQRFGEEVFHWNVTLRARPIVLGTGRSGPGLEANVAKSSLAV